MVMRSWRLVGVREAQGDGIHAIAQTGRRRTIVEDVTKVRIAATAGNRRAFHADQIVTGGDFVYLGDRLPETRPAGAGVELGRGIEQRGVAADAAIDAAIVQVPVFAGERALGAGFAGDVIRARRQLFSPFGFALGHFQRLFAAQLLTAVGKADQQHAAGVGHGFRGGRFAGATGADGDAGDGDGRGGDEAAARERTHRWRDIGGGIRVAHGASPWLARA